MKKTGRVLVAVSLMLVATVAQSRDLPVATRGGQGVSSLDVGLLTPSDQGPVVQNWDSFDIGRGQTFDVLNNTGVLVNNVVGRRGVSRLYGTLNSWTGDVDSVAGGDVVILNPQGISVCNEFRFNGNQLVLTTENTLDQTLAWDYTNLTVEGNTPDDFLGVAFSSQTEFSFTRGVMTLNASGNIGGNASFTVAGNDAFLAQGVNTVTLGAVNVEENAYFSATANRTVAFTDHVTNAGRFFVNAGTIASFRGVDNSNVFDATAGTTLTFGSVNNQTNGDFDATAGKAVTFGNVENDLAAAFDVTSDGAIVFGNVTNDGALSVNAGTTLAFRNVANESNGVFTANAGLVDARRGNLTFNNVVNEGDMTAIATNVLRVASMTQDNAGLPVTGAFTLQSTAGLVSLSKVQITDGNTLTVSAATNAVMGCVENEGTFEVVAGKTLTLSNLSGDVGTTTLRADRVVVGRAVGQAELTVEANQVTTGRLNDLDAFTITDAEGNAPNRFTVVRGQGVDNITIGATVYTVRAPYATLSAIAFNQNNFARFLDDVI